MTIVRWGIIGTGNIAGQFARGLRDSAGATLAAVGSRSMEKASIFGRQFGAARCHGSYAALAEDPTVDAVYVATPHTFHRDNTILCLESGKHVLCEKPLAVNARQAREMINMASRRNLFLMEAMWTRFLPPIVTLRQMLAKGVVGEVRNISADLGFSLPWDPQSRVFNQSLAGGCLLDVGVYPISLATMILGSPISVSGTASIGATGVDERNSISLRYAGGQSAELAAAIRAETPQQASIIGTEGRIDLLKPWWKGGPIVVRRDEKSWQVNVPITGNGYQYEADEVCQCLRNGKAQSDVIPLQDSLLVLTIMDQLRAQWGLKYPME